MPPVDSFRPKFVKLADKLRDKITSGEYQPGANLPSEADLAHEYEVSALTARRALRVLKTERLIRTQPGVRAQVRQIGERAVEQVGAGDQIITRPATADEQHDLNLAEGEPVYEVTDANGTVRILPAYEVKLTVEGPE